MVSLPLDEVETGLPVLPRTVLLLACLLGACLPAYTILLGNTGVACLHYYYYCLPALCCTLELHYCTNTTAHPATTTTLLPPLPARCRTEKTFGFAAPERYSAVRCYRRLRRRELLPGLLPPLPRRCGQTPAPCRTAAARRAWTGRTRDLGLWAHSHAVLNIGSLFLDSLLGSHSRFLS